MIQANSDSTLAKSSGRCHSSETEISRARAIATVLEGEFGAAFKIYSSTSGDLLWPQQSTENHSRTQSAEFANLIEQGRVQVSVLPSGHFGLRLPIQSRNASALVAAGTIESISTNHADRQVEQRRIGHWSQAVLERLQQSELCCALRDAENDLKSQLKNSWELILSLERVVRHTRIHRNDNENCRDILSAAAQFANVEALIWVPQKVGPISIVGQSPLAEDDLRTLINVLRRERELMATGLLLVNEFGKSNWAVRYPAINNLMLFAVPKKHALGWVLAINKQSDSSDSNFRQTDAAALAPFASTLGLLARGASRYGELKELLVGLTQALASAVDAKDPYTYGHSERVARIAIELGKELGLSEDELSDLYLAGLLHDVGKIGIRDDVLTKGGTLTPEELEHIREHPVIGYSILKDLEQIQSILPGVLYHHERYDGGGYPRGLAGEEIPFLARILAVADGFDAMSSNRPYRKAMSAARVVEILTEGAGRQWDPRIIQAFTKIQQRIRNIQDRGLGESLRQALDGALRSEDSSKAVFASTWSNAPGSWANQVPSGSNLE